MKFPLKIKNYEGTFLKGFITVIDSDNELVTYSRDFQKEILEELVRRANVYDELMIFVRSVRDNLLHEDKDQIDFYNQLAQNILNKHDTLKTL